MREDWEGKCWIGNKLASSASAGMYKAWWENQRVPEAGREGTH